MRRGEIGARRFQCGCGGGGRRQNDIRRIRGTAQLEKKGKQEKKRKATFKCDSRNEMPLIGDDHHFLARNVEHDGFPCKIKVAVKKYNFFKKMPTSQKVQGHCVLAMRRSTGKGRRVRTDFKVWGKGKKCGWVVAPSGFRGHLFKSGVGRGKEEGDSQLRIEKRVTSCDGHYKQDEREVILLQNIESTRKKKSTFGR